MGSLGMGDRISANKLLKSYSKIGYKIGVSIETNY